MSTTEPPSRPSNRVSADAFAALRDTRLALAERLLCRVPAGTRNEAAFGIHALVTQLHERSADQHAGSPVATAGLPALSDSAHWALWEAELRALPLNSDDFASPDPAAVALRDRLHADIVLVDVHAAVTGLGRLAATTANDSAAALSAVRHHLDGAYLTSFYKGVPTPAAAAELLAPEHAPLLADVMVELLHEELGILAGSVRPVLVCLGAELLAPLRSHFAPLGYEVLCFEDPGSTPEDAGTLLDGALQRSRLAAPLADAA